MKSVLLLLSATVVWGMPPGATAQTRKPTAAARRLYDWKTVSPEGGGFSIDFPAPPSYERKERPSGMIAHDLKLRVGTAFYQVGYSAIPEPQARELRARVTGGEFERRLRQSGVPVMEVRERRVGGFAGVEYLIAWNREVKKGKGLPASEPRFERALNLPTDSHLYSVTVSAESLAKLRSAEVERFFSSFRLTGGARPAEPARRESLLSRDDHELYRSEQHKFRIKFPKGWEVVDGDGPNVVKKAIDREGGGVVAVLVKPYIRNPPTDEELLDAAEGYARGAKVLDPGAQVLESGIRHLSYRKASYAKIRLTLRNVDEARTGIMLVYATFHKGRMYLVQASAPEGSFADLEPALKASVESFLIEDFSP